MANEEHLEILQKGVEAWNQWREKRPWFQPDLSNADLHGADLCGADLSRTSLYGADLCRADLSKATLIRTDLRGANLRGSKLEKANLSDANLSGANLSDARIWKANLSASDLRGSKLEKAILVSANLSGADLRSSNLRRAILMYASLSNTNLHKAILQEVDLSGFDLSGMDLSGADLSDSNLTRVQVLGTNFEQSVFTGTCLEDWHINSATKFDGAICDYVYLKANQQERRPREGIFKPGEFAALFQQAVDTVDLIFKDGIDWQVFFQSFKELRTQYAHQDLSIQAIEKKRGGAFVVRVEVAEGADKTEIEGSAKELYETKLALMEQRYRAELQAKDGEIVAYRKQSANLMKITEMLAARPPMSETPKYDLRGAQFAGGFAETVQGDQVGGTINNQASDTPSLAEAAAEIQALLKQLEQTAPAETMTEKMTLATQAIAQIEANPTFKQRAVAALTAGGMKAFESAIDHPVAAFVVGAIEEWKQS